MNRSFAAASGVQAPELMDDAGRSWPSGRRSATTAGAFGLSMCGLAHAHPGEHGHDWLAALLHLVSEPDHLAGIVLAVGVIAVLAWRGLRRKK